tara:strand:- start:182 stop:706 length:525 start_codon:yes stop_codon:yes gene_type:complete
MPTGRKQPQVAGGILARKQHYLNRHTHARVPVNQEEGDTWIDFARINIYDKHENGMTEGQVRNFIKRLGKAKRGGILKFEVLVHKKFIKYFPKNIPLDISPNGGSVYPDDAWYVKTYGNGDTRKEGRMMIDCGVPQGKGEHRVVNYRRSGHGVAHDGWKGGLEEIINIIKYYNR